MIHWYNNKIRYILNKKKETLEREREREGERERLIMENYIHTYSYWKRL